MFGWFQSYQHSYSFFQEYHAYGGHSAEDMTKSLKSKVKYKCDLFQYECDIDLLIFIKFNCLCETPLQSNVCKALEI